MTLPYANLMKSFRLIIFLLILLVVAGGFWFKGDILGFYNNFGKNLENFQKTDLGNMLTEVGKEILTPPPLHIGGKENKVVLVKDKVIAQTNIQRYNNDLLIPLFENSKLNAVAQAKAEDMFEGQYFEHISPSGVDPGTLVKSFGYNYITTGENLILGNFSSEKEMVQLWMESPGHRANILNERFTEIGVAVLKGTYKGETVWIGVQEFGLPFSSCPEASYSLKNEIEYNKATLDQMTFQINAKRNEIERAGKRSENYNLLIDEYNDLVAQYNQLNEKTKILIVNYNSQINNFNKCVTGN